MAARMDHTWKNIGHKIDHNGELPFRDVFDVMLAFLRSHIAMLTVREYFLVSRRTKTDVRNSLGDDTLEALLVVKSN